MAQTSRVFRRCRAAFAAAPMGTSTVKGALANGGALRRMEHRAHGPATSVPSMAKSAGGTTSHVTGILLGVFGIERAGLWTI